MAKHNDRYLKRAARQRKRLSNEKIEKISKKIENKLKKYGVDMSKAGSKYSHDWMSTNQRLHMQQVQRDIDFQNGLFVSQAVAASNFAMQSTINASMSSMNMHMGF